MVLSGVGCDYIFPIVDLGGGGGDKPEQEKSISIVQNGTYSLLPDSGMTLSRAVISVNVPPTPTQEKSISITENGDTEVTPDAGMALSKVSISVNVASTGLPELSLLPQADPHDGDSLLYIENNGEPQSITVSALLDSKLQTVSSVPQQLRQNNYIFLEVKSNG